ncbi:hypothetical protein BACCIP111895_02021 [Neobacillus rhizosphaerae]|uniref:Uncharacterized protein n=1 Tax=Neobacillus rhizosphaerae TaxID=2880965 RepID=A0ABM9EQE7_9BACI|nr:hypothetical protein [Neobacillus rhizosphaerae]CAH2714845.1 hypothetical protein BACCIP111895_02021 [Neobacillus rhizosphaerae]
MEQEKDYVAAELSPHLVSEIQTLEDKLSEESHKEVVVIAYEKE